MPQPTRNGPGRQTQTVPSVVDMESRRQKPQSPVTPTSLESVGGTTTEAEQAKLPRAVPPGARVETEH
jgi:SET domain-containing protein